MPDVGAALAAMHFGFAAKAAPTINAVFNEKWNNRVEPSSAHVLFLIDPGNEAHPPGIICQSITPTSPPIFEEIADLLEIQGANPFRIRAYRNAARTVGELRAEARALLEKGEDLTELPGIGDDLAAKIHEIVDTGTLQPARAAAHANCRRPSPNC